MTRFIVVLLLLAVLLAVTNPSAADFQQYARSQASQAAMSYGPFAASVTGWLAGEAVHEMGERQDYALFSIYTLQDSQSRYVWLGIFKNFVPISVPS